MKYFAGFFGKQLPFKPLKDPAQINPHVLLKFESTKLACNAGLCFKEKENYTFVVNS